MACGPSRVVKKASNFQRPRSVAGKVAVMARRSVRQGSPGADRRKITLPREFRPAVTTAEQALWAALRRGALGRIVRRQHVIRGWIVDF